MDSRNKGKRIELQLVAALRAALGDETISRNLDQPAKGGADLKGETLMRIACECKSATVPQWSAWFRQARDQAEPGQIPVLSVRPPRKDFEHYVLLDTRELARFIRLLNALEGL